MLLGILGGYVHLWCFYRCEQEVELAAVPKIPRFRCEPHQKTIAPCVAGGGHSVCLLVLFQIAKQVSNACKLSESVMMSWFEQKRDDEAGVTHERMVG